MPVIQPAIRPVDSPRDAGDRTGSFFPLALAAYFIVQVIIRVTQQGALELDEAEQVFFAQQLKLGYGTQPPLYAWLQWLMFKFTGVGHLGLSLLKNLLLFGLYWSVYRAGRLLLGQLPAAAIAASLVLIVPLGWEAQIDRTHSILATTLAAAALWTYFAVLRQPQRFVLRLLLGLLLGLGMQSKYNFAIFALGLAGASLTVREHRRTFWTRRAWLTLAAAVLVLMPHSIWFAQQLHEATNDTIGKMSAGQTTYAGALAVGTTHLLVSIASFVTPLWLAFLFAYRGGAASKPRSADARFLLRMTAIGLGLVALLVAAGQLAHIKSRWLQPLLFALPLATCVAFPPRSDRAYRRLLVLACSFAAVMTVLLALRPALQLALGRVARLHQPYAELGTEIRTRFPGVAAVAVPNADVGGNLRLQLAGPRIISYREICDVGASVLVLSFDEATLRSVVDECGRTLQRGKMVARSPLPQQEPLRFDYALAASPGPSRSQR